MTYIILEIKDHEIFFDAEYHAGEHDTCTVISTVSNMLVAECIRKEIDPAIYDKGHVRIKIKDPKPETAEVFRCADDVLKALGEQAPQYVKIY